MSHAKGFYCIQNNSLTPNILQDAPKQPYHRFVSHFVYNSLSTKSMQHLKDRGLLDSIITAHSTPGYTLASLPSFYALVASLYVEVLSGRCSHSVTNRKTTQIRITIRIKLNPLDTSGKPYNRFVYNILYCLNSIAKSIPLCRGLQDSIITGYSTLGLRIVSFAPLPYASVVSVHFDVLCFDNK